MKKNNRISATKRAKRYYKNRRSSKGVVSERVRETYDIPDRAMTVTIPKSFSISHTLFQA